MSHTSCSIGVDFGTESGRVLVLDLDTGAELAVHVVAYEHGVIDAALVGTGEPLPGDWALQHPGDWTDVVQRGVPAALADAGVAPERVAGLGVDFTSCTVLPADAEGLPLCLSPRWRERRHAWPKLWKHHAAQHVADRLNEVAQERDEPFLERYGGRISSEWYFPKLIELWAEDREVYEACDVFLEATDWIVWWLTGRLVRQSTTAGYKAMWSPAEGLPPAAYFGAAYPGFDRPAEKLGTRFAPLGTRAGALRPELAARLGLPDTVAVAVGNVDSFVSVPGAGVEQPRTFVMVIGTSICDMVVDPAEVRLPGITGVARDGILPGLYGYEAGQAAVGDMLAWFVRTVGAATGGDGAGFGDLEAQAAHVGAGAAGLVALDWFNGNRTILADADLTGSIVGLTLQTTPAEIYRALLESIAFGNRRIMDNFTEHGLGLDRIVACGGIAERSPLTMQIIADVSGREVDVPASREVPARGAALFGAVAAGTFPGIGAAVEATRPPIARTYVPDPGDGAVYERVYPIFHELHDLLGRSQPELLHELKRIRAEKESDMTDRPRIGLLGIMQELYDDMVPGITARQSAYAAEVAERLADVAEVRFPRPARNRDDIEAITRELLAERVDGIAIVMLTYGPAMRTVRALLDAGVPLLLANIQPEREITADWTMDDLTYNQGIHGAQDQANALVRAGIPFSVLTGDWRSDSFAERFEDWARAAAAVRALRGAKVALLGYPMNGMGDILPDLNALLRRLGVTIVAEDLGTLIGRIDAVRDADVEAQLAIDGERFDVAEDLPRARHAYAARIELAIRAMLEEGGYAGFTFHFDALGGDGRFRQLPLLGASNLMADGYGFAAEGDVNTASLMCAAQTMSGDAHFSELYAMDWELRSVLVSHMGEGNWRIARRDRPVRLIDRPLGIGRLDNPPTPVFAAVPGPATTAALVQLDGGRMRLVVGHGTVLDTPELPKVEMHHFHFRPDAGLEPFMDRWLALGAPHHFVTTLGDHRGRWRAFAEQLALEHEEI